MYAELDESLEQAKYVLRIFNIQYIIIIIIIGFRTNCFLFTFLLSESMQ